MDKMHHRCGIGKSRQNLYSGFCGYLLQAEVGPVANPENPKKGWTMESLDVIPIVQAWIDYINLEMPEINSRRGLLNWVQQRFPNLDALHQSLAADFLCCVVGDNLAHCQQCSVTGGYHYT